jgi:NAD(P)-dependent dehydrogenase (short-subunit alcohol dehydrogenase family)
MRLERKAAVVTGATSGLGREVLLAMAAEGAKVVGLGRNEEAGARVVAEAELAGGTAVFQCGDVTREEDIIAAIRRCRDEFGGFDIMHNNAGILGPEGPLHETTTEGWDELNDINLKGVFFGCKYALLAMLETGGGSIVNTGSILSLTGDPFLTSYTATKTGVLGLTRAIAVDYADRNIRCNCVCAGDMETSMIERYFGGTGDPAAARAEMEAAYPAKRIAHPREVALAVMFLASDEASFVNGTYILVDGALTAKTY